MQSILPRLALLSSSSLVALTLAACGPGTTGTVDGGDAEDAGADLDAGVAADGGALIDAGPADAGAICPDIAGPIGTATLGAGFTVVDEVEVPSSTFAIAVIAEAGDAGTFRVYAVDSDVGAVLDYGVWPNLATTPVEVFDVVPASETATDVLPSFLTASPGKLYAGYSSFTAGAIAVRDLGASTTSYVNAPANFMAAPFAGGLLVQGAGLADAGGASAEVYAYAGVDGGTPTAKVAVDLPADAYSGIAVTTQAGVPLLGAFTTDGNVVRAFAPQAIEAALSGAAVAFSSGTAVDVAAFSFAAGFGDGAAFVLSEDFVTVSAVVRVPVSASGAVVTLGAVQTVLTIANECSSPQYGLLAPIGEDLLVGMQQQDGLHLVRIAAP